MRISVNVIMSVLALLQFGCRVEKGQPDPRESVIAHISANENMLFVVPAELGELAARWGVEDPTADKWTAQLHDGRQIEVFVALVPDPSFLRSLSENDGDVIVSKGKSCTGNAPPGTDDTGCVAGPGGARWYEAKQTVGYSYCEGASSTATCESARVQVGDWIYYSDRCQTETRRVPLTRRVCL